MIGELNKAKKSSLNKIKLGNIKIQKPKLRKGYGLSSNTVSPRVETKNQNMFPRSELFLANDHKQLVVEVGVNPVNDRLLQTKNNPKNYFIRKNNMVKVLKGSASVGIIMWL